MICTGGPLVQWPRTIVTLKLLQPHCICACSSSATCLASSEQLVLKKAFHNQNNCPFAFIDFPNYLMFSMASHQQQAYPHIPFGIGAGGVYNGVGPPSLSVPQAGGRFQPMVFLFGRHTAHCSHSHQTCHGPLDFNMVAERELREIIAWAAQSLPLQCDHHL